MSRFFFCFNFFGHIFKNFFNGFNCPINLGKMAFFNKSRGFTQRLCNLNKIINIMTSLKFFSQLDGGSKIFRVTGSIFKSYANLFIIFIRRGFYLFFYSSGLITHYHTFFTEYKLISNSNKSSQLI